jgi:hypothetical protein
MGSDAGYMQKNRDYMKNLLAPQYEQMIADQGFSQDYKNKLGGSVIGTLAGARGQYDADLGKEAAALGMTNTGFKRRNMNKFNRDYLRQISDARTGVDLESRNEFWRALQGAQGMAESLHGMSADYTRAKQADDANSFWGTFKRGLASGLASGITGGMSGYGQKQ